MLLRELRDEKKNGDASVALKITSLFITGKVHTVMALLLLLVTVSC